MKDEASAAIISTEYMSESEDEDTYKPLAAFNGTTNTNGPLVKNRRHASSCAINKCSTLSVILTVSLTANIALVLWLVLMGSGMGNWTSAHCNASQVSTEEPISQQVDMDIQGHFQIPPKVKSSVSPSTTTTTKSSSTYPPGVVSACQTSHLNGQVYRDSAVQYHNIFEDLSAEEIQAVYGYLASQQELQIGPNDFDGASHIYGIELHVPNKTDALSYLEGGGSRPVREAIVVIERQDLAVPVVEEYIVGPLSTPSYHHTNPRRSKSAVPQRFLPTYGIREAFMALNRAMNLELRRIIIESYGTFFADCADECLMFLPQRTSSAYSDSTIIVLTAYYATDFVTINPVGLMFVMKETSKGSRRFNVDSVFYAGRTYSSVREFIKSYGLDTMPKTRMTFPRPAFNTTSRPGTMNLRGTRFPKHPQAGSKEFEPEGKRYSVTGQHVRYLEWSFNLRMSTASGPQVWDVRWAGDRIAFEISLQDVVVLYAGANPATFYAHLSDSAFGLGDKAYGLVPGADCPEHATFIPQTIYSSYNASPKTLPNAFCLFEHNTGVPLRRHRSDDDKNGRNYGGLLNRVLILRTIITEYNYDYIFDFVFNPNGALELKTYATGYVMSQNYNTDEAPFGFRIYKDVVGSIHQHVLNYKIDLDIQGRSNRYETLDFVLDERTWPWHRAGQVPFQQIAIKHDMKRTEREAVLHYNFTTPKYHIVYNEQEKNLFGNPRAYRIDARGFSKQILPDDSVVLRSRKWSKYQMLTTQRKEEEASSSSIYSMFDGDDPLVDIDKFLQDNESIVDQVHTDSKK